MKENIFEKLRSIQSLTYTDGNGDEIRSILIDIAHEVNSIVKDYCDSKENVTVKFNLEEKLFLLTSVFDHLTEAAYPENYEYFINIIKKVCKL